MGLCKCPKRVVTNQFCFEHRVNVCEVCMVTNHPKCIVQSYLQWLQDSDYNPVCELCTRNLNKGECIRLTCYHVFHWSCAETHFRSLPLTTAPAGYQCPSCATAVFPAPNLVSPVADVLRERLAGVNWARAGLGLPLLSEEQDLKGSVGRRRSHPEQSSYYGEGGAAGDAGAAAQRGSPVGASDDDTGPLAPNGLTHSIVQMQDDLGIYDSTSIKRNDSQGGQIPRKVFQDLHHTRTVSSFDHDENKYKQKSTFAWIMRWWKNSLPSSRVRRTVGRVPYRYWLLLLVVVAVVGGLLLLSHVERSTDDDPFGNNPHENARVLQKN